RIRVADCQNAELVCALCVRHLLATIALRVERRRTDLGSPDQRGVIVEVPVSKRVLRSPVALVHHLDLQGVIAIVAEAQKPLDNQQRCGDATDDQQGPQNRLGHEASGLQHCRDRAQQRPELLASRVDWFRARARMIILLGFLLPLRKFVLRVQYLVPIQTIGKARYGTRLGCFPGTRKAPHTRRWKDRVSARPARREADYCGSGSTLNERRASDDAVGQPARRVLRAHLYCHGLRRVRVGVLAGSGRCANPRSSSRPVSGWGTREACEQALTQKLASDSERDTDMEGTVDREAGRPRLWVRRKGHSEPLAVYSYFCLPDTLERGGAKGGR